MLECVDCGWPASINHGSRFCTKCGGDLAEENTKYYCGNESCRLHIKKIEFFVSDKFCGECRSPIIAVTGGICNE